MTSATPSRTSIRQAPVHILIAPREHIVSMAEAGRNDSALLGHLMWAAARIARANNLDKGYRVVVNTGADGGQYGGSSPRSPARRPLARLAPRIISSRTKKALPRRKRPLCLA